MSFFTTSNGEQLQSSNTFEHKGFEIIPDKTRVKAVITEAAWSEYQGEYYINIRWDIVEGTHKGKVVFQKVKVEAEKSSTRDNALRMLLAIDTNAGGRLAKLGRKPTDTDLQAALTNKIMIIQVRVWKMDGKEGNWVDAVAPAGAQQVQAPAAHQNDVDDVPF